MLAYPNLKKDYVLETDTCTCTSVHGFGAILSQEQSDGQLHTAVHASRAFSPSERNYGIIELKILAVV